MNCLITHSPYTATWLIPERNAAWAREVYRVEEGAAMREEASSWDNIQCELAVEKPAEAWDGAWGYVVSAGT